jgi:hypothetical protein
LWHDEIRLIPPYNSRFSDLGVIKGDSRLHDDGAGCGLESVSPCSSANPLHLTRALIEPMVENRYGRILFFLGQRQRLHAFIGGEDGADRHGARGSYVNCNPLISQER